MIVKVLVGTKDRSAVQVKRTGRVLKLFSFSVSINDNGYYSSES